MSVLRGDRSREALGRLVYAISVQHLEEPPLWESLTETARATCCEQGEQLFMLGVASHDDVKREALGCWLAARQPLPR